MQIRTVFFSESEFTDDLELFKVLLLLSGRADVDFTFGAQSFSEPSKNQTMSIIKKKSSWGRIDETVV